MDDILVQKQLSLHSPCPLFSSGFRRRVLGALFGPVSVLVHDSPAETKQQQSNDTGLVTTASLHLCTFRRGRPAPLSTSLHGRLHLRLLASAILLLRTSPLVV